MIFYFLGFSSKCPSSQRRRNWLVVTIYDLDYVTCTLHCFFICKSVPGLPQRCFPKTVENAIRVLESIYPPLLYLPFCIDGLKFFGTNKPQECCSEVSIKAPNLQGGAIFNESNRKPVHS